MLTKAMPDVCVCVFKLVMFAYLSGKRGRSASLGKYLNSFQRFLLPCSPGEVQPVTARAAPRPSPESFTAKDKSEKSLWEFRGGGGGFNTEQRGRAPGQSCWCGPRWGAVRPHELLILPSVLRRTDDVTVSDREAHVFILFIYFWLIYWTTRGDTVPFTSSRFFFLVQGFGSAGRRAEFNRLFLSDAGQRWVPRLTPTTSAAAWFL